MEKQKKPVRVKVFYGKKRLVDCMKEVVASHARAK